MTVGLPLGEVEAIEEPELALAPTTGGPVSGRGSGLFSSGIAPPVLARLFRSSDRASSESWLSSFSSSSVSWGPSSTRRTRRTRRDGAALFDFRTRRLFCGAPFGRQPSGFDMLGRVMYGGQTSLEVGFAAAGVANPTCLGVVWGAVSGFFGGWLNALMMRIVDVLLSVPLLFLLIVLAVIFHPSAAVADLGDRLCGMARARPISPWRNALFSVREYVQAVRGQLGGSGNRIVFRHIIPNTVGTIAVNARRSRSPTQSCTSRRSDSSASASRSPGPTGDQCSRRA